jgi:hypothetical protein
MFLIHIVINFLVILKRTVISVYKDTLYRTIWEKYIQNQRFLFLVRLYKVNLGKISKEYIFKNYLKHLFS